MIDMEGGKGKGMVSSIGKNNTVMITNVKITKGITSEL